MLNVFSKNRIKNGEHKEELASGAPNVAQPSHDVGNVTGGLTHQHSTLNPNQVPWSPAAAVVYAVAIYFVAQILASLLIFAYAHLKGMSSAQATDWVTNSIVAQFWYVVCAEVLTFGAIWWFVRKRGARLRVIGWRRIRWSDPVATLAGFAVYFVMYVLLFSVLTHWFPELNSNQKQDLGFQNVTGNLNLVLTFVSLVVLPPIVEETVFRGFIFTGLRNKMSPLVAALFTSAIFAVAHLEIGNGKPLLWVAALDTFTLSLVLCYLRQKTDSLWPGILLHALKNGIAFVSLYILVGR